MFEDLQFYFAKLDQTFWLRSVYSGLILWVTIELYRSSLAVESDGLTRRFWKAAAWAAGYFFGRVVAGGLDQILASDGWFSNVVNVAAGAVAVYKVRKVRVVLESDRLDPERIELRDAIDRLLIKIDSAKTKLRTL